MQRTDIGMCITVSYKSVSAVLAYLKTHSLFENEDSVYSATSPDSRIPYQPIRSFESAPRREMVSGHRRNGDVPVVGHPSPGFTMDLP